MFALIQDGAVVKYPYTITDLRFVNQNVSFAANVDDDTLASFGMVRVITVDQPEIAAHQAIEEGQPVFNQETQRWQQTWVVRDLNETEIQQRKDAIRNERNALLAKSDWTQLADSTVDKAAWAAYRQALRDIPQQAGFPYNVTYPVTP
jgi:hypothetical protein